ncbi:hypothetical protein JNK62_02680 [bacterium]|nr:hypothetical protein [bacterium]
MNLTSRNPFVVLLASFMLAVLFSSPSLALAQAEMVRYDEENPLPPEMLELEEGVLDGETETPAPAGTVSCFDHYTFGSVQAQLTPSVANTVSGTAVTFSGSVINDNPYPIVDGALYVKVFKSRGSENDGNGPDVVDQFFAKGDIVIPAKGSAPISFQWRVPSYALSGEYELATYFVSSRKFNLLGLSFTDDVVGNTIPFTVSGEMTTGVKFDKAGVTINGEDYYFAAFPPRVSATSSGVVSATLRNTTNTTQAVTVQWTVYQWDGLLRENVVQEESRTVTVPANSSAQATITVTDTKYPVYYVVGTAKWKDTQSVIGARFIREGVDRTRINFPGVSSFPLKAGEMNTLFSCLHNSGEAAVVSGGSLDLTILDRDGNPIHQYTYKGDVTGDMMGVASAFTPTKNYDYFTISARLFQGDQFVDEANLVYDCQAIDPSLCLPAAAAGSGMLGSMQSLAVIALGIIVLIGAIWIYRRVSRTPNTTQLPPM